MSTDKQLVGFVNHGGQVVMDTDSMYRGSVEKNVYNGEDESRQIYSDKFFGIYEDFHEPSVSIEELIEALSENIYHANSVRVKSYDGSGTDYELLLEEGVKESEVKKLRDLLDSRGGINKVAQKVLYDFNSLGFGFFEFSRWGYGVDEEVTQINHIPAGTVRVHKSRDKYLQIQDMKKVYFKRDGYKKDLDYISGKFGENVSRKNRATELYMLNDYSLVDDVYGMGNVVPALNVLKGDRGRVEFVNKFFETHGVPQHAIFLTGDIASLLPPGESDTSSLQRQMQEKFMNMKKDPHGAFVSLIPQNPNAGEVKVTFEKLSDEQKEVSFVKFRKDNRDDICSAHRVPPHRVGVVEEGSLGGSNTAEMDEIYHAGVVEPMQRMVEDFINNVVVESFGLKGKVTFRLKGRDRSKDKDKLDIVSMLFEKGAMTPRMVASLFPDYVDVEDHDDESLDSFYVGGMKSSGNSNQKD